MSNKLAFFNNFKNLNLNFGPQHPAAHGVLRMSIVLSNERVLSCDPHIGLLHRGTEFLITKKKPILSIPYFDRLDYVSMLSQEHAYCLAIEAALKKKPIVFLSLARAALDEVTRILNHLLAVACHSLDVGSMSPIFWSFEERENLMEVYECLSGARMHAAYHRPLSQKSTLNFFILKKITNAVLCLPTTLSEINSILFFNKVWRSRLQNVGVIEYNQVMSLALSGILKRSCGFKQDFRSLKSTKYSGYFFLNTMSFVSKNGDCFDRYILRMCEMYESVNLITTALCFLKKTKNVEKREFSIEKTINSFKFWSGKQQVTKKEVFSYIESPKGVFGVYIFFNEKNKINFCKVKSPSFNHLLLLKHLLIGHQLADVVTMIGTVDIVFGEIDR